MDMWQTLLLIGAILVAAASFKVPRAHLWILAGAASFVASTAYSRFGLPYPPAFTLVCDATVCLILYFACRERWEEWLYRIFQLSVLVSLVYLAGPITLGSLVIHLDHTAYVIGLEICNWLALALIGWTGIGEQVMRNEIGLGRARNPNLRRAHAIGRADRATPPFHKVPK